jgi:hypothetical protein
MGKLNEKLADIRNWMVGVLAIVLVALFFFWVVVGMISPRE